MNYDNLIIYYFTGTGNALKCSEWIIENAKSKGIKTHLIAIDRMEKIEVPQTEGKTLIGIASPTHGFNLPYTVLKFIFKLPKIENSSIFLLNTRGGAKLFKLVTPGLSGIAILFPLLILLLKGFKIAGTTPMDMPSNWISIHPGLTNKAVSYIIEKCKIRANTFADKLLSGKKVFKGMFLSLPFDLLIAPVSIGYFFVGRFFLAKTFISSFDCNTCKICEMSCPTNSIQIIDNRPYWKFTCESCMRCLNICPKKSIQASHSLAAIVLTASFMIPLASILTKYISKNFFEVNGLIDFTIVSIIAVPMFFVVYLIFHFLLRIKFINAIITYTSLTKYWKRYKNPEIDIKKYLKK